MTERIEIAIIGGGLAGLAAATHLHRSGKSVKVFEGRDYVGGRVSTLFKDGFTLDRGFQVLLTAYPECKKILDYKKLDLKKFEKGALIYLQDKIESFVISGNPLMDFYRLWKSSFFSLSDLGKFLGLYLKLHQVSDQDLFLTDHTNALAVLEKNGFSLRMIESFFKPFLGGVLLDRSLLTSGNMVNFILKMFLDGEVALPSKGIGEIPRQLSKKLPSDVIELNSPVRSITSNQEVILNHRTVKADYILLATDPWTVAKLLDLPLPPRGHDVACCYFAAEKSPIERPLLFLNGDDKGPINHLAVLSDIAPMYAPAGSCLVSTTILSKHMHLSDERLIEASVEQLSQWFGSDIFKWKPLQVFRIFNAHPAIYPDRLWHSPYPYKVRPGLYACGDYLQAPCMNSALMTGRKAAEEILKLSGSH